MHDDGIKFLCNLKNHNKKMKSVNITLLFFLCLLFAGNTIAQNADSSKPASHFSGSISITHNGISLVPTFSLGKPAAIFLLSTGKGRFSFEPDIRIALAGKPWSMLFWGRYKLVQKEKFKFSAGIHPALNFRTMQLPVNGDTTDVLVARRFLAAELAPNYFVSKDISIGFYYLLARGFDIATPRYAQFITLNASFRNIRLGEKLVGQVIPQIYYLKQDQVDGLYFTSTFNLARRNFPVSVQSIINKEIESEITGTKSFVWNFSIVYSFSKKYVRK
jgi:hypothetical protein